MKIERIAFSRSGSRAFIRRWAWAAALTAALFVIGLAAVQGYFSQGTDHTDRPATAVTLPEALAQPNAFKPLTMEQAIKANDSLPFTTRRDEAARKFVLQADGENRARAVECLAQAVYYEAASEGADGQRAVAQVVLNRLRHPGYPASICGVVYEGSQRVMGCQFTFTCDGSLLRAPGPAMFAAARKIAIEALAGRVFAPVGHATNYHADYVLPYWAAALDKQVQIGSHIFYRLKGNLGAPSAFSQRYAGKEPVILPQRTIILTAEALEQSDELAGATLQGSLPADTPSNQIIVADSVLREPLAVDIRSGVLKSDDGLSPHAKKTVPPTKECPVNVSSKVLPAAPNDLRSGRSPVC